MSWDAMLKYESALQRRRELARMSKAELMDIILDAESRRDVAPAEHEIRRHDHDMH